MTFFYGLRYFLSRVTRPIFKRSQAKYQYPKMGGEESKVQGNQPQKNQQHPQKGSVQNMSHQTEIAPMPEYDGIPSVNPLVLRVLMKEQYPADIRISSENLPQTHQMVQHYFRQINYTISSNQERITVQTKKQLEEYIGLSGVLQRRQNELDAKLAHMLSLFRQFNDDVKNTTELLKLTIEKADSVAQQIDPDLSFKSFSTN
ncbi:hypothetical protein TRFO_23782 [Tritrichomonas foetus]|uniref:BLOC-1-related complex subunit 5 n=1 Tax=Tritrichomonas foetus TaxID=1144522 RepID=A0A1J4K8V1_9EUKA|nr:hypothetical protein TRFO_23782 [Tritrichomonas foetus]|eukprot:OHT07839.1 hypothetical protein TRFO_23782 [Tritrichomonas foetus]